MLDVIELETLRAQIFGLVFFWRGAYTHRGPPQSDSFDLSGLDLSTSQRQLQKLFPFRAVGPQ
jgi:hypothetical protein